MGKANFGAAITVNLSGKIRDLKQVEAKDGNDSVQCTFNIGVRQYRGAEKEAEYANYYMRAYGKQAEKILKFAKDGTFMVVNGDLDQRLSTKDGKTRVFNNVSVDSSLIGPDGEGGGKPAAKSEDAGSDLPF